MALVKLQYNITVRVKTQIRVRVRVRVRVGLGLGFGFGFGFGFGLGLGLGLGLGWRRHGFPEMTKCCKSASKCLSFVGGHEFNIHADFYWLESSCSTTLRLGLRHELGLGLGLG